MTQAEKEARWDRMIDQLKADVRAAVDRVYAALPDDPLNASGVVEIALHDLVDRHLGKPRRHVGGDDMSGAL